MNTKYNNSFFDENYETLSLEIYSSGKNKFIGDGVKCRFCKKDKSETTFSNISHAIPQAIGNKRIILRDECDICNKFFSENLEDHFDKYTKPYRTFARIKGESKIPTYKSKNKKTRISVDKERDIEIFLPVGSDIFDNTSNSMKISLDFEPHIPAAVYKALVKMALSLIEDEKELSAFQITIKWILEKDHSKHFVHPLKMQIQFIENGAILRDGFVCFLRRKKGKFVPYAIFVIGFGNWIYQILVPSHLDGQVTLCENSQSFLYSIPYFYIPCESIKKVVDLSCPEKKSFSEKVTLKYQVMEKLVD